MSISLGLGLHRMWIHTPRFPMAYFRLALGRAFRFACSVASTRTPTVHLPTCRFGSHRVRCWPCAALHDHAWRHGISSRKFDRVDTALPQADSDGWVPRSRRVSMTIRCVLPGGVCRCAWPRLCDSQGGGPVALPTRISAGGVTASSSSAAAQSHGGKALRPRHLECFNPSPRHP